MNKPQVLNRTEKKAVTEGERIRITFPFTQEDLAKVKTLSGRRYDPESKSWTCPVNADSIGILKEEGWELDENLKTILARSKVDLSVIQPIEVPGLLKELYPFQKVGVGFIETRNGRALIADEMGLGKTAQALAWLQLHPELFPVIIVCPASLKLNWAREIRMWLGDVSFEILSGKTPYPIKEDIVIVNYDILANWWKTLQEWGPEVIITDECHYYKNNSAARTKAIKSLAKGVPHFIALSGTPIVNRPIEGYNALKLIDSAIVPSFWDYATRYCAAVNNGYGWDFSGASNTDELHEKLTSTVMIRRKKADVLTDLPDKVRSFIPIELDNRQIYDSAERDFVAFVEQSVEKELKAELNEFMEKYGIDAVDFGDHILEKAKEKKVSKINILTEIEALKQIAVAGKLTTAVSWIRNFIDTDEKLVVFATHKFVIDRLMKEFKNEAVKIDGSVSGVQRDAAVQSFQNNPAIKLFVGNIKAAGVGITLTAASNVAFLELPWTPGDLVQAEDRVHRIGQKESVNIYYLLADQTIEEEIAALLDKKRRILDQVLDGGVTDDESLLTQLINKFKQ